MSSDKELIRQFIDDIKTLGFAPKHVEASDLEGAYLVNAFDSITSEIITDSVATGVDQTFDIAFLKAHVEWLERKAFALSVQNPRFSVFGNRSDGTAAYPMFRGVDYARSTARKAAYLEALERYVWATWWDDDAIIADITQIKLNELPIGTQLLAKHIQRFTPIKKLVEIKPTTSIKEDGVVIYFAQLENKGWISGGAGYASSDFNRGSFRAFSEMLRHSLASARIQKDKLNPKTFYEERLQLFSCGLGDQLVDHRLKQDGVKIIELPGPVLDEQLAHPAETIVAVHRYLFENQPPFVGGHLERFCI